VTPSSEVASPIERRIELLNRPKSFCTRFKPADIPPVRATTLTASSPIRAITSRRHLLELFRGQTLFVEVFRVNAKVSRPFDYLVKRHRLEQLVNV